jgi:hypothetical protein
MARTLSDGPTASSNAWYYANASQWHINAIMVEHVAMAKPNHFEASRQALHNDIARHFQVLGSDVRP